MNLFISWSGPTSKLVALALRDWLKKVIQAAEPWMSDRDIESGARWSDAIGARLKQASIGIICLTPDNKTAPWLNFEAGAISKSMEDAFVCPYLFRLEPTDIVGPLTQFQARRADKDGTKRMLSTIRAHPLLATRLSETDLDESFDVWWPKLECKLNEIKVSPADARPERSLTEMVVETLEIVRGMNRGQPAAAAAEPDVVSGLDLSQILNVDTRPMLGDDGRIVALDYYKFNDVEALLDALFFTLSEHVQVRAFTYPERWVLVSEDAKTVFDAMGRNWANHRGISRDTRSLAEVGIRPGMVLETKWVGKANRRNRAADAGSDQK